MRRVLLLTLCVVISASVAFAQGGSIGMFSDTTMTDCNLCDLCPGSHYIYVFHLWAPAVTASQFKVAPFYGANLTWIADIVPSGFTAVGNSQSGIKISYNGCYLSPVHILKIQYWGDGLSPDCTYLQVVQDPNASPPGIWAWDCDLPPNQLPATGGDIVVNPVVDVCCCDVPSQGTSWGRIKALYRSSR